MKKQNKNLLIRNSIEILLQSLLEKVKMEIAKSDEQISFCQNKLAKAKRIDSKMIWSGRELAISQKKEFFEIELEKLEKIKFPETERGLRCVFYKI